MGDDLHSIAFMSSSTSPPLGLDFHGLGVFNADSASGGHVMEKMISTCTPPLILDSADFSSTGYLQDVLFNFDSKRRRLLFFPDHLHTQDHSILDCCWASNFVNSCCENYDPMNPVIHYDNINADGKTCEETISAQTYDSSSSSQKEVLGKHWTSRRQNPCDADEKRRKRRVSATAETPAKVVYPFAVVKPRGFEGDATLNDINERILMPPTRAVRHPVGDFACRPSVSPEGPGLSGKAVVAFTKIHTQGSGTITIIRTRN